MKNAALVFIFVFSGCYSSGVHGDDGWNTGDEIDTTQPDFLPDSPGCGNGLLNAGEECDDGNAVSTDGCTAQCRNARCGDGFVWAGIEQCDDGNGNGGDGCSSLCRLEAVPDADDGPRVDAYPDPIVDDSANPDADDLEDAITDDLDLSTYCGDGLCDGTETCTICLIDCGDCPSMCGNGICEAGEHCYACPFDCSDCPPASLPYFTDFSGAVGAEWSRTISTSAPGGERFLGEFGNDVVTLALVGLPAGRDLSLSFDLYIIRSWDGNSPDFFDLRLNGTWDLHTTFSNNPREQSYPDDYPASHPYHTGARAIDTLGFGTESWGDSIYRIERTVHTASDILTITFSGSNLQELGDESWGIDNVSVTE